MRTDSFLDAFLVANARDEFEPFVGYPQKPFQIRRGRVSPLLYLHNQNPGGWFLVNASVLDHARLSNLWEGQLYEGVCDDGQPFLMPATRATRPEYQSWQTSLGKVIQTAQSGQWVSQHSDRRAGVRIATIETDIQHAPTWYPGSFEQLIRTAFQNRLIDEHHPLAAGKRGASRRSCYEEITEEYP